jgi:hypothetical protein
MTEKKNKMTIIVDQSGKIVGTAKQIPNEKIGLVEIKPDTSQRALEVEISSEEIKGLDVEAIHKKISEMSTVKGLVK